MKLTFPVFWLIEYQPDSSSLKYGHPNRGLLAVYWQNVRFSIIISTRIFDINVVPEHLSSAKWFIILDPAKDPNYEPVSLRIPSGTWRFSYLNEMSLYAIKWEREPDSSLSKAEGTSLSVIKGGRKQTFSAINGGWNLTKQPKGEIFRTPYGILFN